MQSSKASPDHLDVNGVFKGGGARGVAYAGALMAARDRGVRFRSVAGSSAGAITATLVAAGVEPPQLPSLTVNALQQLRWTRALALLSLRPYSILTTRRLRDWLDRLLKLQASLPPDGPPISFRELYDRCGHVGLYVVTMDLATKHPVIFHHSRTPDVAVADAVVASCAIPGALTPGRLVVPTDHGFEIHQLVDGGSWANFPLFVYNDEAFRDWYSTNDPEEAARPVLAFALDDAETDPVGSRARFLRSSSQSRRDLGQGATAGKGGTFVLDRVVGTELGRLVLGVLLASLLFVVYSGLGASYFEAASRVNGLPSTFLAPAALVVGGLTALAVLVASLALIAMILLGPILTRTLLPSFSAALGPATGIAPWVFRSTDVTVVSVPASQLQTLGFRRAERYCNWSIRESYDQVFDILTSRSVGEGTKAPPSDDPIAAAEIDRTRRQRSVFERRQATMRTTRMAIESGAVSAALVALVMITGAYPANASARQASWWFLLSFAPVAFVLAGAAVVSGMSAPYRRVRAVDRRPAGSFEWAASVKVLAATGLIAVFYVVVWQFSSERSDRFESARKDKVCAVVPSRSGERWVYALDSRCQRDSALNFDSMAVLMAGNSVVTASEEGGARSLVPSYTDVFDGVVLASISAMIVASMYVVRLYRERQVDARLGMSDSG